jgi:cyclohexanone monooxygenase
MQNGPQGTFTTNFVHQLDSSAKQAAHVIMEMRLKGLNTFEPTLEVEDKWCARVYDASSRGTKFLKECTPGYYNR